MEHSDRFEVIIVGCGIAGASLAYFLAERGMTDVLILEREDQPGYHATGRSAGVLVEIDPVPSILSLKLLAAPFLRDPPSGFAERPLLERSGILTLFHGPMWETMSQLVPGLEAYGVGIRILSPPEILERIPALKSGFFDGGLLLTDDGHIDVHELLWSYLRHARGRGVALRTGIEVKDILVERGRCAGVITDGGWIRARWVVNAAGAWAARIAVLAGAAPIQLTPLRRTIISFDSPGSIDARAWPLVVNYSHLLYFSPEAGGLYASPMDEDPSEPCDARPDDRAVAQTLDRLGRQAPALVPRTLRRKWAGLRTFAPDQGLVVGEDPLLRGFFWLAGQGGAGIETSPAVGQIAADLLVDGRTERLDAASVGPDRFRHGSDRRA